MPNGELSCAVSGLLTQLLDGPERPLTEVARTRVSVHYETGDAAVPVLSVCTPDAVRLPASVVTATLPPSGPVAVGEGRLRQGQARWRVTRWWQPSRPAGLVAPVEDLAGLLPPATDRDVAILPATYDALVPAALVGMGPGLTPAGDDVLAGALVAAHATADPRLPRWCAGTRPLLTPMGTTAVSRALLHHALDGYATAELAGFLTAVCRGTDVAAARDRLVAVGHTSGSALLVGVLHTLVTRRGITSSGTASTLEGAA